MIFIVSLQWFTERKLLQTEIIFQAPEKVKNQTKKLKTINVDFFTIFRGTVEFVC